MRDTINAFLTFEAMKIVYLNKENRKEIESFMKKHKDFSLWQSLEWDHFQKNLGRTTFFIAGEENGAVSFSALIIRHDLPWGYSYLEIPRGPLFHDSKSKKNTEFLYKEIKKLGKEHRSVFCRVNPYDKNTSTLGFSVSAVKESHPPDTIVIDVSMSEEEILAQMKQKGRYNIRLAEKKGVKVVSSKTIDDFYTLIKETTDRDGFSAHKKEYYKKMIESLGDNAQLLLASYNGKTIAGGIFTYISERAVYYYGASSNKDRNLMAPYLLQWEAIKEAKKRGCKLYDFLGIAPENSTNHSLSGVTAFKKKFGGEMVSYIKGKDVVLRSLFYLLYRLKKWI